MKPPSTQPNRARRGMSLVECTIGAALLATLLAIGGQAIVKLKLHTRKVNDRMQGILLVENTLEKVTARPWKEIEAAVDELQLAEADAKRWPRGKLSGRVVASTDPDESKRVTITLALNDRSRPVTLTTWVFRAKED